MGDVGWRTLWKPADEKHDTPECGEFRSGNPEALWEPVDAITMACAVAEFSDVPLAALASPWALSASQQAAAVASALFTQTDTAARAPRTPAGAVVRPRPGEASRVRGLADVQRILIAFPHAESVDIQTEYISWGTDMRKTRKLLGIVPAAGLVAAVLVAGPVALATPAQASTAQCVQELIKNGYLPTDARINACAAGSNRTKEGHARCVAGLAKSGVGLDLSNRACDLAAK